MSAVELFTALGLPPTTSIQQRIPKKLLSEQSAVTASDRKLIQDYVQEVQWLAAIKPSNAGIPCFEDEQRSYLEVAVVSIVLRQTTPTQMKRVAELLHRAVPYPVVLILNANENLAISMAHIRWAQQEAEKTVLDDEVLIAIVELQQLCSVNYLKFKTALALNLQTRTNLHALYQSWIDTLSAWHAASITGQFVPSKSRTHAIQRRQAFLQCQDLDEKIRSLRIRANKEKQMARQVEVNLEIKRLLIERQKITTSI
jgi:hypothetical protein